MEAGLLLFDIWLARQEPLPVQGPMLLLEQGYRRHGEVFTVPVLHKKITFIIGPHASPHFYKASDDDMSQKEVCYPSC